MSGWPANLIRPARSEVAAAAPEGTEEFSAWYQAEHPKVLAVLCILSGDPGRAREAADEAFSRCYGRWESLRGHQSQDRFVCRAALSSLRRARWRGRLASLLRRPPVAGDAGAASGHPLYQDAVELLAPLRHRQRCAMLLRYAAGLSEDDVAWVLRVPRGTVTSTLAQARRKLASFSDIPAYLEGGTDG